jgi:hypothetical protein
MASVVDLLCRAVETTFLDVRIRSAAAVDHTWKGVELLRDLRYAAVRSERCKFNGGVKFDGNDNVKFRVNGARLKAAATNSTAVSNSKATSTAGGLKTAATRATCRELLAFFGFLELG